MLTSHLNIGQQQSEEEEEEALTQGDTEIRADDEEEKADVFTPDPKVLHKSEISVRLSWLGKTAEGDGYAYLKAECTNMGLTDIQAITCFKHLQFVDISENNLTTEDLQHVTKLPFLLLLKADKNLLKSAHLSRCKYLQVMIMNLNDLKSVEDVYQPELSTLEVGYNKIVEIKFFERMDSLRVLDFRYNAIHDILNLDCPNVDSLYLAGNKINSLTGIDKLPNLRILHVRNNPIKYLNGFETTLEKLKYINLRNCKVATHKQIKKLRTQKALEVLILKGTPYLGGQGKEDAEGADEEEDPELRIEVLATLPRLKRLNKTEYSPEERAEAKDLMMQWLEEGEKEDEEEVNEEAGEEIQGEGLE